MGRSDSSRVGRARRRDHRSNSRKYDRDGEAGALRLGAVRDSYRTAEAINNTFHDGESKAGAVARWTTPSIERLEYAGHIRRWDAQTSVFDL